VSVEQHQAGAVVRGGVGHPPMLTVAADRRMGA
jgi:hypothetical protein